jgi:cell shape-determining protein MreC
LYAYELAQGRIQPKYVLIIKDFNSTTTTKEQLITIFNQSHISIIFIDELFNNLPSQIIREQVEQIQDITITQHPQQETEEENKLLREQLLHAEEKIKQLEEEILSLKTQKQSKSIKDYFGKK